MIVELKQRVLEAERKNIVTINLKGRMTNIILNRL